MIRNNHSTGGLPPGGMIEQIAPERGGLPRVDPRLRQRVLALLEAVVNPVGAPWPFRENPDRDAPDGLETACWALLCLHGVKAQERLAALRPVIACAVDRSFRPEMDFYLETDRLDPGVIGAWRLHNDWVCRATLETVGLKPRPHPRGRDPLRRFPWAPQSNEELEPWLSRCEAVDPRVGVKEVFQYLRLYCDLAGIERVDQCDAHADRVLDWLQSRRDPETGLIGKGPATDLGWAMRGHRNLALNLLWRLGVDEPEPHRLIDSTLACRRSDHLFHDASMCANMDAVHLLAEYGLRTDHRRRESLEAIRACVATIFAQLATPVGGFRYTKEERLNPLTKSYGTARLVNGTLFVLNTIRYWQALDPTGEPVA